jgi:hypothetical protein
MPERLTMPSRQAVDPAATLQRSWFNGCSYHALCCHHAYQRHKGTCELSRDYVAVTKPSASSWVYGQGGRRTGGPADSSYV